jgi:hypothetical protein
LGTNRRQNVDACTCHAEEWAAKVKRYVSLESVHLRGNPKKTAEPEVQKQAEAAQVLAAVDSRDYVVVLDERGKQFTSYDFAHTVATAGASRPQCRCNSSHTGSGSCRALPSVTLARAMQRSCATLMCNAHMRASCSLQTSHQLCKWLSQSLHGRARNHACMSACDSARAGYHNTGGSSIGAVIRGMQQHQCHLRWCCRCGVTRGHCALLPTVARALMGTL